MPSTDNNDLSVLVYRVTQLEEMLKPLMSLVNELERKLALLAQKMVIATMLIGVIVNGIGVWYSANSSSYTEPEKKSYYEQRISDSEKIKLIEDELNRLRSKNSGSK